MNTNSHAGDAVNGHPHVIATRNILIQRIGITGQIMGQSSMQIYTIGHSNHTWEKFRDLLKEHEIMLLIDTRSRPVSSYAPFANYRILPDLLYNEKIDYEFMGDTLGGKPANPSLYDGKGKPDYRKIRTTDEFQSGIGQLVRMSEMQNTVVMCSEEDPTTCHRRLLLGPALEEQGVSLVHIRANGSVQQPQELGNQKAYIKQLQSGLFDEEEL